MTSRPDPHGWREAWVRRSLLLLGALTLLSLLVGFLWLPSEQGDFSTQGLWASICRAAGVPGKWSGGKGPDPSIERTTRFVMDRALSLPGSADAVGRGATLAQQCMICHAAQGRSEANAPNLAGQYPEAVVKQLTDFENADRASAVMQSLSRTLSPRDMLDLAAYFSYLPVPQRARATAGDAVPRLVKVGDPMRNIAPCASCHGGVDHKLGAPWLEGMPADYLGAQLRDFASGLRRNDSHAQMRNMARALTATEIVSLADFYSGHGHTGDAERRSTSGEGARK